ncbi:Uncharacterised protein r2_g3778 [Pycnogonum litorale]
MLKIPIIHELHHKDVMFLSRNFAWNPRAGRGRNGSKVRCNEVSLYQEINLVLRDTTKMKSSSKAKVSRRKLNRQAT